MSEPLPERDPELPWAPPSPLVPPGPPPFPPYGGRPTNHRAQAALWSGIGLLLLACFGAGVFGVVPVVLGVLARREIRAGRGRETGSGMAFAGIVLGVVAVVVTLVVVALVVLVLRAAATAGGSEPGSV